MNGISSIKKLKVQHHFPCLRPYFRPHANFIYRIHNPVGIRLLMSIRLGLSYLSEYEFRHNFADCMNPLYSCSIEPETTLHFFLHCHNFLNI